MNLSEIEEREVLTNDIKGLRAWQKEIREVDNARFIGFCRDFIRRQQSLTQEERNILEKLMADYTKSK